MKRFFFSSLIVLLLFQLISLKAISQEVKKETIVKNFVRLIRVKEPISYKSLKIYPLFLETVKGKGSILSLDEATEAGYLKIYERERPEVNSVFVENFSKYYIFLMSGELLTGCKQDRMVAYDTLLPPKSGRIRLKVYCTERRRWFYESNSFKSLPFSANPGLRKIAVETESQERVWESVSLKREELKTLPSATDAFQDIIKDKRIERKIEEYVENIDKKFPFSENVSGVVVSKGNEILCMDLFYHPRIFKKLWHKLLRGYILDSIEGDGKGEEVTVEKVGEFISEILKANFSISETDGEGDAFDIESKEIRGTVLLFENFPIHIQCFPKTSL